MCILASKTSADVITDWNLITVNATKTGGLNSNLGSRIDAIEAIAVYDAVNSIRQFGTKYHYYVPSTGSAQAAAAKQTATASQEDSVKLSAEAQAKSLYKQGQSVSTIASTLGTDTKTVNNLLGITLEKAIEKTLETTLKA